MAGVKNTKDLLIGLDGKRALCNNTGLGNYSRYMVNIMSLAFPSTRFRLYSPVAGDNERLRPLLSRGNVELEVPDLRFANGLSRAIWRTFDLPVTLKKDNVALYHGLSNELPLTIDGVVPSVVTIHDLIWRRVPGDYKALDRKLYDWKYGRSAKIATRVIAISECTKRDLMADYGIDPAKIDVIYQGVDPIFTLEIDTLKRQDIRARYKLPEKYILSVGTIQLRKNQLLAVEALAKLPADLHLIYIGKADGDYAAEVKSRVKALGLTGRIRFLEGIPFADLPALYADAVFSSYTSRYEGFGLPVVESLTVGTPVIAATGSCLEEAGGRGAVYVHPDDVEAYVQAAMRLLDDRVYNEKLAGLGRRHVRQFSADAFAKATMATYNKAIIDFLLK